MRIFTGQYDRSIDKKNRIQLPAQLRAAIDKECDGSGLYINLGDHRGTLSIYTERGFEELASRIRTEVMSDDEAARFEMQFFALASYVEVDEQGRFVIPDRLRKKANLGDEVYLIGQKTRIDVWNRADFDQSMGIDWSGDDWPKWRGFLRMSTEAPSTKRENGGA